MRGPEGKRRQRAVLLTDRERERIGARAKAAGMPFSRHIAHRLAGPAKTPAGSLRQDGTRFWLSISGAGAERR